MTIATRLSKSWAIPKFDIKDPSLVLYLPLWYPYSDMAGSTIYSYDTNRFTGTVTEATWGRTGRKFDGINDKINLGNSSILTSASQTVILWIPDKGSLITCDIYCRSRNVDEWTTVGIGYEGTRLFLSNSALDGGQTVMQYADVQNNDCFAFVLSGTDADVYRNGVFLINLDFTLTWDLNPTFDTQIGSAVWGYYFDGVVGEVIVYNRALSAGEVKNIYQVTKWRYQ